MLRVDCRGTGASEGITQDEYTLREQRDGHDAVEWCAAQPWCDGHVNMIGISYGGFTSLQVASHAPPHLTSIVPIDFTDDRYTDDCHYRGGHAAHVARPGLLRRVHGRVQRAAARAGALAVQLGGDLGGAPRRR